MGKAIITSTLLGAATGIATGINWAGVDLNSDTGKAAIASAVKAYFSDLKAPASPLMVTKGTQPGVLDNLPTGERVDLRFWTPREDQGIMRLFRYVDKRQSKDSVYRFASAQGAIVFRQTKPGEPARIQRVSPGAEQTLSVIKWMGGLGISDDAKRFDAYDIWEQNVQSVPSGWNNKMADVHATLILALSAGVDQTWATDLATTVNNACAKIQDDVGDKYNLPDNQEFVVTYNPNDAQAIVKMMQSGFLVPNDNNSATQLVHNLSLNQTRKIPAGKIYVSLPGFDSVSVEWDGLSSEMGRDHIRGEDQLVWMARLAPGIGEVAQHRRITLQ